MSLAKLLLLANEDEGGDYKHAYVLAAIAVDEENEACARIAEAKRDGGPSDRIRIAAEIRGRHPKIAALEWMKEATAAGWGPK